MKFLDASGGGNLADSIRAIDYAVTHGARILNNSWGGEASSQDMSTLKAAIERARQKGVLFVAAAGNSTQNNDDASQASYPAGFDNDNIIAVAATDDKDVLAYFSHFGAKSVHVAAPGVNIYSTIPGNKYEQESGTSMACPHVTGAAALLWSMHPTWTYLKVKKVLMSTVDPLPSLKGKTVSGGRINVMKALKVSSTE